MQRLSWFDCYHITTDSESPFMEMHSKVNIDNTGQITVECWHKQFYKPEAVLKIGDLVHINVKQYDGQSQDYHNYPKDVHAIWAELRQFEIIDMYSEEQTEIVGLNRKSYTIVLKEKDRKSKENDGQYWMLFNKRLAPYGSYENKYLTKIGSEISEQKIEMAKQAAIDKGSIFSIGHPLNLEIAPTSYVQWCWEYYVEHEYFNKNYGKAAAKTINAFPDQDNIKTEKAEYMDAFLMLVGIGWSLIPEGNLGFIYLVMALFFSGCVFVMYNGWFIIICIWFVYWIKNATLKTNSRFGR